MVLQLGYMDTRVSVMIASRWHKCNVKAGRSTEPGGSFRTWHFNEEEEKI